MELPEIVSASEVKETAGRYPSQIVLRRVKEKTYATHLKVIPPDAEPYFILGNYFFDLKIAQADFERRVRELAGAEPA